MGWIEDLLANKNEEKDPMMSMMSPEQIQGGLSVGMPTDFKPVDPVDLVPNMDRKPSAMSQKEIQPQPSMGAVQSDMNPMVKEHLMKNIMPSRFSEEAKMDLMLKQAKDNEGIDWKAGLSGLAGALQDYGRGGNKAFENVQAVKDSRRKGQEAELANFEKGSLAEKKMREDDPTSEESKMAQEMAIKMGMSPEKASGLSASKFKEFSPTLAKMLDLDNQKLNREEARADRREGRMLQREANSIARDNKAIDRDLKLRQDELDLKNVPLQDRETITGLAKKNVDKETIANSIDSVVGNWDNMSDDDKLQQGRQLIKVLNSTQGADAVGTEEAKRLAGKLEFAMGNLTNDNPVQFGRDLEGFGRDAQMTSKAIRDSMKMNEKVMNSKLGKPASGGNKDAKALEWAKANPGDPRSSAILKRLGM